MSRFRRGSLAGSERYEIRSLSGAEWDSFWPGAAGATPFCSADWINDATAAADTQPVFLAAVDKDQPVAGVAGGLQGRRLITPDLLPHTGFLFRPTTTDRLSYIESERSGAAAALIDHLQATFDRVHLTHAPEVSDGRPFVWAGWDVHPRYTYHLDLPEDRTAVWDGLERRTRTAIRKAQKEEYRVEPTSDVDEFQRLYRMVYDGGAEPVSADIVADLTRRAVGAERVQGWRCVSPQGETASVVFFVATDETLYAWVAGADPAHRDSGATSLLYWSVLEQTDCRRFDFVGANLQSVAFFKRGFGGALIPYLATIGYGSRLQRTLSRARRLFS